MEDDEKKGWPTAFAVPADKGSNPARRGGVGPLITHNDKKGAEKGQAAHAVPTATEADAGQSSFHELMALSAPACLCIIL